MSIDWSSIFHGAVGGIVANKAQKTIDEALPQDQFNHSTEDYIRDIHHVLVSLAAFLRDQSLTHHDIYTYVTLYKAGQGAYYRPVHTTERSHFQIFSPVAVTLNVTDSGLGPFNLTLSPAVWTTIDFPEGSKFQIDSGYTANSLVIYERETSGDVI